MIKYKAKFDKDTICTVVDPKDNPPITYKFAGCDKLQQSCVLVTVLPKSFKSKYINLIKYLSSIFPGKFIFENAGKNLKLNWIIEDYLTEPVHPRAMAKGKPVTVQSKILEKNGMGQEHLLLMSQLTKGYNLALGVE